MSYLDSKSKKQKEQDEVVKVGDEGNTSDNEPKNEPKKESKYKVITFGEIHKTDKDKYIKDFADKAECQAYVDKCECGDLCTRQCKTYKDVKRYTL